MKSTCCHDNSWKKVLDYLHVPAGSHTILPDFNCSFSNLQNMRVPVSALIICVIPNALNFTNVHIVQCQECGRHAFYS